MRSCGGSFDAVVLPDDGRGHRGEVGEAPVAIDAEDLRRSHMCARPVRQWKHDAAGDMALGRDVVALGHAPGRPPDGHDRAAELVASVSGGLTRSDDQWSQRWMCRSVPQMLAASMRTRTSSGPGVGTGSSSRTSPGSEPRLRTARIVSTARRSCHAGSVRQQTSCVLRDRARRRRRRSGALRRSCPGRGHLERAKRTTVSVRCRARVGCRRRRRQRASLGSLVSSGEGRDGRTVVEVETPATRGQTWISAGGAQPASPARRAAVAVDEGDELGGVFSTEDRDERKAVDLLAGIHERNSSNLRACSASGRPRRERALSPRCRTRRARRRPQAQRALRRYAAGSMAHLMHLEDRDPAVRRGVVAVALPEALRVPPPHAVRGDDPRSRIAEPARRDPDRNRCRGPSASTACPHGIGKTTRSSWCAPAIAVQPSAASGCWPRRRTWNRDPWPLARCVCNGAARR